jgi:chorismate synthase
MSSTLGQNFKMITFGESHGKALGVVLDNVKPGLKIDLALIQKEMDRRRPGQSKVVTPRDEKDQVQFLSGIFEGKTTGAPICMVVYNKDQDSSKYAKLKNVFRPGHADFTFLKKYGIRDHRGGGRSSGRETLARVAAGAIAKQMLAQKGIKIYAYTREVYGIEAKKIDFNEIENNIMRCPDKAAAKKMVTAIMKLREQGDSAGGIVEVVAQGVPAGLGDPVFDKLEADLAKAMLSVGATKGVEVGRGFEAARMTGSQHNDALKRKKFKEMFTGGISGGISSGSDIVMRVAVKPTSSITKKQHTENIKGDHTTIQVFGRHDPCICPRVVPVLESMTALVLWDKLCFQQRIKYPKNTTTQKKKIIETIDEEILALLAERQQLTDDITELEKTKAKKPTPTEKKSAKQKSLKKITRQARKLKINEKHIEKVFKNILN